MSFEATKWSELPELINKYLTLIDNDDGILRVFGYASLIDRHDALKPTASKSLPNEYARLSDMEVAMNIKTKKMYAGLEPSEGGMAEGIVITVVRHDRKESLAAYMKRELGEPPWGTSFDDIYNGAIHAFASIKDTAMDNLKKYKMQIVQVEVPTFNGIKKIPALAVITNGMLETSIIGITIEQCAQMLLEDSKSMQYFKNDALRPARICGLKQRRLEEVEALLKTLKR